MDLIVGAGVSGISYANFTKNDFVILEKELEIGHRRSGVHSAVSEG